MNETMSNTNSPLCSQQELLPYVRAVASGLDAELVSEIPHGGRDAELGRSRGRPCSLRRRDGRTLRRQFVLGTLQKVAIVPA
jgi:hypothetical protein